MGTGIQHSPRRPAVSLAGPRRGQPLAAGSRRSYFLEALDPPFGADGSLGRPTPAARREEPAITTLRAPQIQQLVEARPL